MQNFLASSSNRNKRGTRSAGAAQPTPEQLELRAAINNKGDALRKMKMKSLYESSCKLVAEIGKTKEVRDAVEEVVSRYAKMIIKAEFSIKSEVEKEIQEIGEITTNLTKTVENAKKGVFADVKRLGKNS